MKHFIFIASFKRKAENQQPVTRIKNLLYRTWEKSMATFFRQIQIVCRNKNTYTVKIQIHTR